MLAFRVLMHILVVLHALFVLFTAMVGAFADGGRIEERLVAVFIHPLSTVGLVLMVFGPRLSATLMKVILVLLIVNVIADVVLALLIARGSVKGDWELPLVFALVPALGIVYALTVAHRRTA